MSFIPVMATLNFQHHYSSLQHNIINVFTVNFDDLIKFFLCE